MIEPSELSDELIDKLVGFDLETVNKKFILRTYAATGGNKAKTSRILGISEKTLYNKLNQWKYKHEN